MIPRKSMRPRIRPVFCATLAFGAAVLWPAVSRAANQEPAGINLGSTSFLDGFGRNEEGFTYLNYLQYGMARSIRGDDGKPLPYFNDPKIDAFAFVNQLIYVLPEKLFNDSAHIGIDFILPVVAFNTSFAPPPPAPGFQLKDNGFGLGDLTFGPLLQFRPIIADGRPVFSARAEFDVIAPIGSYDPEKDINQSSNFVSLNPYCAVTVLPLPHLELSVRFNYLYNFKNWRPALGRNYGLSTAPDPGLIGGVVRSAQAGQAGWANFAASFEFLSGLHAGVNGYYFQQFNLDLYEMQDGSSNAGTGFGDSGLASILAIGPGALWEFAAHDKLFANVYFQTAVHNLAHFTVFNLHWVHGF
jgi:hypothetical protein